MKTILRGILMLGLVGATYVWADEIAFPPERGLSTDVWVIRGKLISEGKDIGWPLYRITKVGRGVTSAREIALFTSLRELDRELPKDAIVLLDAGASNKQLKAGRIVLPLVSRDPNDAIFAFAPELWTQLCSKTDAELADSPMDRQMAMCDALKTVFDLVREKHAGDELFFRPPRRRPYGWIITVFRVNAPYIDDEYFTVMDSGKVFPPGMRCGLLVKPNEDISTPDKLDAYLRDTYKDRPEEMPRRFEELCSE
jgi:hypothetical protein